MEQLKTPIIDLGRLISRGDDADVELQKLDAACKDGGIFQVVNHGMTIRPSLMEKLKVEIQAFNKLPVEERNKFITLTPAAELLEIVMYPLHKRNPRFIPLLPSSLSNTLEYYSQAMQLVTTKLLVLMAKALKVDPKEVKQLYEGSTQSVKMEHYTPSPQVNGNHVSADDGAVKPDVLNILYQVNNGVIESGFEVKKDGVWSPVSFLPDALIVNVGQILEIFTKGVYHGLELRVVPNSDKERTTIAFFTIPKEDVKN